LRNLVDIGFTSVEKSGNSFAIVTLFSPVLTKQLLTVWKGGSLKGEGFGNGQRTRSHPQAALEAATQSKANSL
jgi:hypothetical protein